MGKIRKFYQLHKTLQHFSETEEKKMPKKVQLDLRNLPNI